MKPTFTVAVVGFAKCGKSRFLCTMPNPLFLQFDANTGCVDKYDHRMIDFTAMEPKEAWALFNSEILPAIYNRDLARLQQFELEKRDLTGIQSICLDSETFCFETMQDAIPIPTSPKGEPDTYKWYRKLREAKKQQYYRLMGAARPFPGDPGRPRFNIGVACHMKGEFRDIPGSDKRVLEKYVPAIEGAFKDKFEAYTKSLFWCEKERKGDDTTYFMHTKSPSNLKLADDSVGGEGPYKVLPPRIENGWGALMEGWGVCDDPSA